MTAPTPERFLNASSPTVADASIPQRDPPRAPAGDHFDMVTSMKLINSPPPATAPYSMPISAGCCCSDHRHGPEAWTGGDITEDSTSRIARNPPSGRPSTANCFSVSVLLAYTRCPVDLRDVAWGKNGKYDAAALTRIQHRGGLWSPDSGCSPSIGCPSEQY